MAVKKFLAMLRYRDDLLPYSRNLAGCNREVQEGCDVFNRPRSAMIQVEDAELVEAKGLTISNALDCFHYLFRGECSCHLQLVPLGFPRHYSGLS